MKQLLFSSLILLTACTKSIDLEVKPNQTLALIGNNLCSRMINYGYFETEVQLMFPESQLTIRNMCDGGDTPGFRPHSGRNTPWAFPGAEKFQTELATKSYSEGHFEYPDEWLTRLKTDVILAFFGYNESFAGKEGLENFKGEMDAFIKHTLQQKYNGTSAPQLVLVSPIAFEDLSDRFDLPNGKKENENLKLYSDAIKEVAEQNQVPFVDVFTPTKKWFARKNDLTIDGFQLNDEGYRKFSQFLAKSLFGKKLSKESEKNRDLVHDAVMEKNWFWHNDYKIPNGVHVFGRRYNPFGPDNYPEELQKIREMTAIRDTAIWMALQGKTMDLAAADQKTTVLPQVETNYKEGDEVKKYEYLYGEDALASFSVPEGYKIELFASEQEFPELANPVQISFDNKGRLWVATMPTYPHYKPGDARPNDKILIFEDTDNDGKADKQIVFAEGLHIPAGFEIAPEGVYVSQGTNLVLLIDKDGDDRADVKEILLSGFDDHDTHHVISAFCADPSGAIFMGEGVFLHTNVETPYGPVRATNGGFMRYNPARRHLERTAQMSIPNPWGIAFDDWGQNFFLETSGPALRWMMPSSMKNVYGVSNPSSPELVEPAHRVRPTSGLEFISSRHFPDEVQGDIILANTIGFLGIKQHTMAESGTGYQSSFRQDLLKSSDGNFRPVDLEFAPDGSLFLIDWHNVLVGHMQHNARDPLRDHVHGRIYRITYPSRPLVEPAKIADASIPELYENLKLPEYRTRYRTRRELRGRDSKSVLAYLEHWKVNNSADEKGLLEGLWVSWGLNKVDEDLLKKLLKANDYKVRAAAVRVLRYSGHQIANQKDLLMEAARDIHGRVRMEAMVAGTWLDTESANLVVAEAAKNMLDEWLIPTFTACLENINKTYATPETVELGKSIYERDGYCQTCHQADGKGLEASGFPGLAGTDWVTGDEERLIKITLKGLIGPIEVNGKKYPGQVPMTPFEGLLNDEEVAAVLSYIRSSFGNQAGPITAEKVGQVRKAIADKKGYYSPEEL
jgi:mono/diheme cytochrome c family protein/glucose/arabinose dehydrogenase